jgi:hypothetical protein
VSRLALGPTQPHIQWIPGVLSPGLKRGRGVTLTTHLKIVPRSIMSRIYTSAPIWRLYGGSGTPLLWEVGWLSQYSVLTTDWTTGFRSPTETKNFLSNLCVQTKSGVHPCLLSNGYWRSFPGAKVWSRRDADHSHRSSAEVKNE